MKQYTFLTLLVLLALSSCRKRTYEPFPPEVWEDRAVYQSNMKIDTSRHVVTGKPSYSVVPDGEYDVFMYSCMRGVSNTMSDDEYYANMWFPVDPEQTSFSYTDGQLAEHRCFYSGSGAWGGYGYEMLEKGTISGSKDADGSWEINIDVTLKATDPALKTSHIVRKKTFIKDKYW